VPSWRCAFVDAAGRPKADERVAYLFVELREPAEMGGELTLRISSPPQFLDQLVGRHLDHDHRGALLAVRYRRRWF